MVFFSDNLLSSVLTGYYKSFCLFVEVVYFIVSFFFLEELWYEDPPGVCFWSD
jgi:hypothetical protein